VTARLDPLTWPDAQHLRAKDSAGFITFDGSVLGRANPRPLGRAATVREITNPPLTVSIGDVQVPLFTPEFVAERGGLRWIDGLFAFEGPRLRVGWWFLSPSCAAAFGAFPLLVSENVWARIAPRIASLEVNSSTGLSKPPANRRRDLGGFATAIEARREFPDFNEVERHEAVRTVRRLVGDIEHGGAGRPSQSTGNPAARVLAPLDAIFDEIVRQGAPLIDPKARGQGVWGAAKARAEFHRMVREAEPAPGTPPKIVALRRQLLGTEQQRDDAVASLKRSLRRKRTK